MIELSRYWKQLGPIVATLIAVANVLGPQWAPGYVIAGVLGGLVNLFAPANAPVVPAPPKP